MPNLGGIDPEKLYRATLREIFYGTLIFEQGSMICIGHVGHTLHTYPPTWRPKLLFVKRFIVTLRCPENVNTSSFQQFP